MKTHKKKVWVVGKAQFLFSNSVVVTLVHVMHNERSWPDKSAKTNRRVHRLINRARKLVLKAEKEL
jgi:hypothetical protein